MAQGKAVSTLKSKRWDEPPFAGGAQAACSGSAETVSRTLHAMCTPASPPACLQAGCPCQSEATARPRLGCRSTSSKEVDRGGQSLIGRHHLQPESLYKSQIEGPRLLPRRAKEAPQSLISARRLLESKGKSLPASPVIYPPHYYACSHRSRHGGGQPAMAHPSTCRLGSRDREIVTSRRPAPPLATTTPALICNSISTTYARVTSPAPNLATGTPQRDRQKDLQASRPISAI